MVENLKGFSGQGFRVVGRWAPGMLHVALLAAGVLALLWYAVRPWYYSWVLGGSDVEVVIFCDSTPFVEGDVDVFLLYDRVALSPLARALGIAQNRKPEKVSSFFTLQTGIKDISSYALTLGSVPEGPLVRVLFVGADGTRRSVDVSDRTVRKNKIHVRVE